MKKKHIGILVAILVLDQITKYIIDASMSINEQIPIIKGFFSLTYTRNTGAAWSIMEGRMIFFYIITIVALIGLWYFYKNCHEDEKLSKLAIVFMIAGACGNFIDRLIFQYVRDFLDFNIFGYDFPIFNVADSFLCIGVGLIILDVVMEQIGVVRK